MKELQPNILDDFEHRIGQLIDHHGDEADFPKMEGTGLTRQDVDDFLFDYQAILDMHGTQKTQLTVYGIIALLPVLAVSAFPDSMLPYPEMGAVLVVGISYSHSFTYPDCSRDGASVSSA